MSEQKWVDLHLHTTFSDGVFPPAEIVRMAKEAGMAAIAIADHDNADGIGEAMQAGSQHGVEVISGVELSVVYEDLEDLHLLGYGFDPTSPELQAALKEFRDFRASRNDHIVARVNEVLAKEGRDPLDFGRVRSLAGGTFGRPHIAMALLEKGYARNTEEAFDRYLVPCNVSKRYFPIVEAMELIRAAGGITVLAHPPFITRDRDLLVKLLDSFTELGLTGVEAYNSGATNDEIDWYITLARRRGLIVTGGSDFHGVDKDAIAIGRGRGNLRIPYACLEEIRSALAGVTE